MNKKWHLLPLTAAVVLALSACNDGGSDNNGTSDSDNDSTTTSAISGVVADGYLKNATVCLDINLNKQCDANEPQAVTGDDGSYTLTVTPGDESKYPVLSIITADTTDADDPTRILEPYVMSAPPGHPEFVSPLTTMIQTEIETNPGLSVAAAENAVKDKLGYGATSSVSLFKDYVAAKADASDSNKTDYERIHKIAQITARTLEANHGAIQEAATEAGLDADQVKRELVRIVVKEVMDQLQTISTEVDKTTGTFDPGAAADKLAVAVDTSSIADDVSEEEALSSAASIDIKTLLTTGVFGLDSEFLNKVTSSVYEISKKSLNETGDNIVHSTSTRSWDTETWNSFSTDSEDSNKNVCQYLTASGVVTAPCFSISKFIGSDDGTATVSLLHTDGTVLKQLTVTATEIDLAGKRMRPTFKRDEAWLKAIPGSAIFGDGAKGYRWTYTTDTEQYRIRYAAAEEGSTCLDDYGVDIATTNCIVLRSSPGGQPVAATGDISALADGSTEYLFKFGRVKAVFTQDETDSSKGSVAFTVLGSDVTNPVAEASSSYSIETPFADGPSILLFDVPPVVRNELNDTGWSKLYFVEDNGYVRRGGYFPAGIIHDGTEASYNEAAIDDVKGCFQGGDATGTCAVSLFLRDSSQVADGEMVPVSFDNSKTMVPFNLEVADKTLKLSSDGSTARWSFALNADGSGTFTSASGSSKNVEWKITANGRLKIWHTKQAGSRLIYDTWIVTTLSDGSIHVRRKRTDRTKNFGGFMTMLP